MRVTLPPSFTEYTSGSKYTPAPTHKERGPSSEVSAKMVAMQSRKSKQPQYKWNTPHVTSSRTPTASTVCVGCVGVGVRVCVCTHVCWCAWGWRELLFLELSVNLELCVCACEASHKVT